MNWNVMTWPAALAGHAMRLFKDARHAVEQFLLFTPDTGQLLLYAVTSAVLILCVGIYLHYRRLRHPKVVVSSLTIPVIIGLVSVVPPSFYGNPDNRCADYEDGKLNFQLISASEEPVKQADSYGDTDLLLLVLAPDKWGETPHLCRLSNSDERVKSLYRSLLKLTDKMREIQLGGGSGADRGHINFTFGSGAEIPNVTLNLPPEDSKKGPPEVPLIPGKDGSI
jgi:hypothetical protein